MLASQPPTLKAVSLPVYARFGPVWSTEAVLKAGIHNATRLSSTFNSVLCDSSATNRTVKRSHGARRHRRDFIRLRPTDRQSVRHTGNSLQSYVPQCIGVALFDWLLLLKPLHCGNDGGAFVDIIHQLASWMRWFQWEQNRPRLLRQSIFVYGVARTSNVIFTADKITVTGFFNSISGFLCSLTYLFHMTIVCGRYDVMCDVTTKNNLLPRKSWC